MPHGRPSEKGIDYRILEAYANIRDARHNTALTLIIVPLLYYSIFKNRPCPASLSMEDAGGPQGGL